MPLKVLYITIQFPVPSETFAAVEIRALRAQGAEVSVATLKLARSDCNAMLQARKLTDIHIDHNSLRSNLRGLGTAIRRPDLLFRLIRALAFPPPGTNREIVKSLATLPRTLDLFDKIRRSPPDILHLYWGHYPSLLGLLVQEHLEDTVLSLSLSAYDLHSRYGPGVTLARKAPLVFTLANANKPALEDFGVPQDRINVVYHGVDADREPSQEVPQKNLEILVVERLVSLKRTADCLHIFRRVLKNCPTVKLTILGDGPERARLEALAQELDLQDSVLFMGHVSHDKVFDAFARAKILLSMSSSERLPNTVKEAMFRGSIPVVARTPGIEELISDQETGFIVEQGDIEQAAKLVVHCLKNWEEQSGLRTAARCHIIDHFSSRATARQRIAIWQQALNQKSLA